MDVSWVLRFMLLFFIGKIYFDQNFAVKPIDAVSPHFKKPIRSNGVKRPHYR